MAKKVKAVLRLQLEAGKATPAPPVGPALGQHGVNIMAFVKDYNERTASQTGTIVPAEIIIYDDRSFTFTLKTPPTSELIRKALGIDKGSPSPRSEKVGKLTREQVEEIARIKLQDLNAYDVETARRLVEGSARSMGVEVA
ncbi:MAG TPA: 50S ribosomal protein L11 [Dehalococcoidia bacterium]|nr:50S ribosomal protein L11 [Dehalococcoidia bacterium]